MKTKIIEVLEKPNDVVSGLKELREICKQNGISFNGDENRGRGSGKGFSASYIVLDKIVLTITEKPFLVPESLIRTAIKKEWNKYLRR